MTKNIPQKIEVGHKSTQATPNMYNKMDLKSCLYFYQKGETSKEKEEYINSDKTIMDITVWFIPITELAYEPEQMTPGSAGYDLRFPRNYILPPKERIFIPTDLMTQMQPGFHGIILSRSGPALNSHVHTAVGLIDGDYRGNIGILLYNLHQHMPFHVA